MKTKLFPTIMFIVALCLAVLGPQARAQMEFYTDTLKVNTTAQFSLSYGELDSMQICAMFSDSASGRIRIDAINTVTGREVAPAGDTLLVYEFGPNAGASIVTVSEMFSSTGTAGTWAIFPAKFRISVIFYDDAATYGGFADQSVKYFTLAVRKFRHIPGVDFGTLTVANDTLKRSATMAAIVALDDLDSIQILTQYADSAMGRIRVTAYNNVFNTWGPVASYAGAVTADSVMAKLLTGKNVGGGQDRVCWTTIKGLGVTTGSTYAFPAFIYIEVIFDATVTALGDRFAATKLAQMDIRRFRHK